MRSQWWWPRYLEWPNSWTPKWIQVTMLCFQPTSDEQLYTLNYMGPFLIWLAWRDDSPLGRNWWLSLLYSCINILARRVFVTLATGSSWVHFRVLEHMRTLYFSSGSQTGAVTISSSRHKNLGVVLIVTVIGRCY